MKIFSWLKKKPDPLAEEVAKLQHELTAIKNDISITDSQAFKEMFLGGVSPIRSVNAETVMTVSAVFACVRLIAGAIASAPVVIYKRSKQDEADKPFRSHPYHTMLSLRPNDHLTASTFWKTMATNKVLHGNAYAAIIRGKSGRPTGLVPFKPYRVVPYQAWELGLDKKLGYLPEGLIYAVTWDNGKLTFMDQDDMIHVPNIGWDGKQGMSTIKAGAQAMGLALSAEVSAASLFEKGMVAQFSISYPNKLNPDAQDKLREYLNARYTGSQNHNTPLILTEGGEAKALSLNPEDVQLLQSRQFSVVDIARFFGVPPVMIGETEKTSSWGSGVEQMARWFVMFTLNDHLTDIEQEIEKKLFGGSEYYASFDEAELTRGDTKTRAEYFKAALGGTQSPAWMTQNEVRRKEGLPPSSDKKADQLSRPVPAKKTGENIPKEEEIEEDDNDQQTGKAV